MSRAMILCVFSRGIVPPQNVRRTGGLRRIAIRYVAYSLVEETFRLASSLQCECLNQVALAEFARRLAEHLPMQVMLAVAGDLGAGKTTLIKELADAVGIDPRGVTSPTFGIVHVYPVPGDSRGQRPRPARLVHMDAYRLSGLDDLATIGWEELVSGAGWLAVEWPERIAAALPAERIELQIEITGETSRRLHLKGTTAELQAVVSSVAS